MTKNAIDIRKITISAILLAAALVVRAASITLPIAGAPVVRVSFGAPFIQFSAIMFGPVYGGIVFGLLDLVGFMLYPTGGYIPWITLNMVLQGVLTGLIWKVKVMTRINERVMSCIFGAATFFGAINLILMKLLPDNGYIRWLSGIGVKTVFASGGLVIAGIIGLLTAFIGRRISPIFNRLLFAAGIPALIGTTVNTYILRAYMLTADKPFLLLWIPKITESFMIVFYNAYVLMILIGIYELVANGRGSNKKMKT